MADNLMDWFLAAMLHDIGKTLISERGWWGKEHADLSKASNVATTYSSLLTADLIENIRKHEWRMPQGDSKTNALIMADQLQKAMYESMTPSGGMLEQLVMDRFDNAHLNPSFFPYYGHSLVWSQAQSQSVSTDLANVMQEWKQQPTLKRVLEFERKLVHAPHTTNIPHNSLAFHQRFVAIFFFFIYRQLVQLKSVYDWRQLDLAVVTIKPDPLNLFYRLKDVKAHEMTVQKRLRNGLFERVFKPYVADLPQVEVDANPFEFFGRDAVVVVAENSATVVAALREILNTDETESLRHLTIDVVRFSIRAPDKWASEHKWDYVPPRNVSREREGIHLLSSRAARFEPSVTPRCERCGQPLWTHEVVRGAWCTPCAKLIDATQDVSEDLDTLGNEGERRGFVFLNLAPLSEEAKTRALDFFAKFKGQSRFANPKSTATPEQIAEVMACLKPTPTGIFEYLQAVMEIQIFQDDVQKQNEGVYPLVQFPELMIWVMSESKYWDFIVTVNQRLQDLQLSHSLSGVLCHPRTPFWSLMDRLTMFTKQEGVYKRGEFYDLSGGEVMVFSDDEVKAIRDLAKSTYGDMAFKSQLNALVQMARVATLRELEMEIDERDNLRKLRSEFCKDLKIALNRMTGDDQKSRDKRALFIKNIVRLAGYGAERRK